jgi:hypothetical protein
MIPARRHVTTMYSGSFALSDNQRRHHPTHRIARTSPPPRSTAEWHLCPGLVVGRPKAAAPCLHRCGFAIGRGINPSFSSSYGSSVGMCV